MYYNDPFTTAVLPKLRKNSESPYRDAKKYFKLNDTNFSHIFLSEGYDYFINPPTPKQVARRIEKLVEKC
jgi:hypothetical protein